MGGRYLVGDQLPFAHKAITALAKEFIGEYAQSAFCIPFNVQKPLHNTEIA